MEFHTLLSDASRDTDPRSANPERVYICMYFEKFKSEVIEKEAEKSSVGKNSSPLEDFKISKADLKCQFCSV